MPDDQVKALNEIRDVLREQLPEFNRLADEALGVQRLAIATEERTIRGLIFFIGVIVGASLMFFLNRGH